MNNLPILIEPRRPSRSQLRDNEPPGFIHIPKHGLVKHADIHHFESSGSYCFVYLKKAEDPILVSEGMFYFQKRLPEFIRVSRQRLENFDLT